MTDQRVSAPPTRAKAILWARSVVANEAAIFLDTETCGKGTDSEVCDIGIVAIDGTVLLNQLVKPSNPIPAEATEIHVINNEMVADAPTWAEIEGKVERITDVSLAIIYNAQYDVAILRNEGKRLGSQITIHHACAMLAYSDYDGTPGKWGSLKWHKLEAAAVRFGIPPGGHRALADAETTRRVVLAMAADTSCDEALAALPDPPTAITQGALFDVRSPDRFAR